MQSDEVGSLPVLPCRAAGQLVRTTAQNVLQGSVRPRGRHRPPLGPQIPHPLNKEWLTMAIDANLGLFQGVGGLRLRMAPVLPLKPSQDKESHAGTETAPTPG